MVGGVEEELALALSLALQQQATEFEVHLGLAIRVEHLVRGLLHPVVDELRAEAFSNVEEHRAGRRRRVEQGEGLVGGAPFEVREQGDVELRTDHRTHRERVANLIIEFAEALAHELDHVVGDIRRAKRVEIEAPTTLVEVVAHVARGVHAT